MIISINSFSQNGQYLNQKPPSIVPEIFASGIISKNSIYEFGSVFNKNATEFYYGINNKGKEEIRYTKLENGKWTTPKTIMVHDRFGYNDPFLSPDENRLYIYISKGFRWY